MQGVLWAVYESASTEKVTAIMTNIWVAMALAVVSLVAFLLLVSPELLSSYVVQAGSGAGVPRLVGLISIVPIVVVAVWALVAVLIRKNGKQKK